MAKTASAKRSKTPVKKTPVKKSKGKQVSEVTGAVSTSDVQQSVLRLLMWIGGGTTWFYTQCNSRESTSFTLAEAFYYASQTGLNIGFTVDPIHEELCSAPSKFLTTCYCLYGVHAGSSALSKVVFSILPNHRPSGFYVVLAILYMVFGALVLGMYTMEFSMNNAWYYSVTSLTTSGLQGPNSDSKALILTSIFALIGVPIVARACEEAGNLFGSTTTTKDDTKQKTK